jgi:hypothetical protein
VVAVKLFSSARRSNVNPGRLLLGLLLAVLGVLWLLDALGVLTIDWDAGLPIAVIVVGVAVLAAGSVGRGSFGLVALGIVLTVLLLATTIVPIPLGGGVGDRTFRPVQAASKTYDLAMGALTIDLTAATVPESVPADVRIDAHVGVGQLVVMVPARAARVDVHAKAGIGEVMVFGEHRSGFGAEYGSAGSNDRGSGLVLEVSVGIGQVDVRRG